MTKTLRLFILAGEASGDRIAADLVRQLRTRSAVELTGVGGEALATEGLVTLFPMQELSVMGWSDVLPRLPRLVWRARQVAQAIIRSWPDVVVLVDAQVFSSVVAEQVRRAAPDIPVVLCVAPAVWAWKPERARSLLPKFREVLAVLPFEPAVMQAVGGPPTTYVGHPATQLYSQREAPPESGPMLLLPGSREGELRRHLLLMRAVAAQLADHPRITHFVIPTPRHLADRVRRAIADWPVPAEIVTGETAKVSTLAASVGAVAVTGTVTLELALAGVPMVTTYVADKGQAKRWFQYKVKFAALPNAILDHPLVPEMLQLVPDPDAVAKAMRQVLDDKGRVAAQLKGFADIRTLMEAGTSEHPRVDPAARVLANIRQP